MRENLPLSLFFLLPLLALVLTSMPIVGLAQNNVFGDPPPIQEEKVKIAIVADIFSGLLKIIWPIFMGLAVAMFLFAGFSLLFAHDDVQKIEVAKKAFFWGAVGLVVALLAFSLPFVIRNLIFPL